MNRRILRHLVLCVCCLVLAGASIAQAQTADTAWSTPTPIADTEGRLYFSAMTLLEDRHGNLHLLFPFVPSESETSGIDHTLWDGQSWSKPNTVLVNADGSQVMHVRGVISRQNEILVAWEGSLNRLFFARAPADRAGDARAWSRPTVIGVAVTEAGVAVGPDGQLWVAYADAETLGRIALVSSADQGLTWSNPRGIVSSPEGTMPSVVSLVADDSGILHMTWTGATLPTGDPLTGVFYSRSVDGGLTWEEPRQFDDLRHGEIGVGLGPNKEVHVVWRSNIGGDGTFHQWSSDSGVSWSTPDQTSDRGGISGLPSFGLDGSGVVHMAIGPAFAATWTAGKLSPWENVASERLSTNADHVPGWTGPELANLAVRNGNEVHVVFETDYNRLWHTYRRLGLPAARRTPVTDLVETETPEPTVSASPTAKPSPEVSATPRATAAAPAAARSATSAVVAGSVAAAIVVLVAASVEWMRRRR